MESRTSLLDRARTEEKNIDESPRALRPAWHRRDIGDADKSPEQIEWIEVWTDVAALDGSFYERMDRSLDQIA